MPTTGEKSGRMLIWMRRADEIEFGQRLHGELGSAIVWRKIMPGFQKGPSGSHLGDLLGSEGNGGRLQLTTGGPIIQYLGSWLRPDANGIAVLRSGELAFRWSPADHSLKERKDFEALAKLTFRAMKECTLPGLVLLNGKPYRSGRIGKAALELVRSEGVHLRDTSAPRNQLDLKLRSEK